ncbi:MAG: methyltransferase [Holophagaceae bacterium]
MDNKEVRVQPPQAFLIHLFALLVQWALGAWLLPAPPLAQSLLTLRWALFVFSVAAFLLSKVWMVKFFAKHSANPMFKDHAKTLITEFPFSVARNPFYLLDVLPFLGLTLILGTLDPLLLHCPLFFLFLNFYIVPAEENRLLLAHGADYEAYKVSVKRWGLF